MAEVPPLKKRRGHALCNSKGQMLTGLKTKAKAVELRQQGLTWQKVGERLGITERGARKAVEMAMKEFRMSIGDTIDDLRAMELSRLDAIQEKLWAKRGDPRTADTLLRVIERRCRIMGLDMPTKVAATDPAGDPVPMSPFAPVAQIVYIFPPNGRDELSEEQKASAIEHEPTQPN